MHDAAAVDYKDTEGDAVLVDNSGIPTYFSFS
jgi:hypothetical protein